MLSIRTATFGLSPRIFRVATRPLVPGIAQSITTTAGLSCFVSAIASSPLLASPTTSIASSSSSMRRKPRGTRLWSSARSTVIVASSPRGHRHFHANEGAAVGRPKELDRSSHERCPLAHRDNAKAPARRDGRQARAVVFDLQLEHVSDAAQADGGSGRPGVAGYIAQGLLEH